MTKADNIFKATRYEALNIIEHSSLELTDRWVIAGWCYGKTPEGQQFMSQRTLNAVNELIDKEEKRLDLNDRYGISARDPKRSAAQREAVRVLRDMAARQQREFDREKQERADSKTMSYDEWIAKYYPQYC